MHLKSDYARRLVSVGKTELGVGPYPRIGRRDGIGIETGKKLLGAQTQRIAKRIVHDVNGGALIEDVQDVDIYALGALPLRLETPDLLKRIEQGVLNKVVGVTRAGWYLNSKTLTSVIQGIGDWVLDSINPRSATRQIYLDFSQPVLGSGPNGSDPSGLPAGDYVFRALAQCASYGNSLLSFTAGQIKTCPLRIGFDAGTKHYAIIMNPTGGVNGPFPETDAATVTCIYPSTGSAPCSQWRFTPSGTYIAPDLSVKYRNAARLLEFDSRNNVVADHGDFYMSFSIVMAK